MANRELERDVERALVRGVKSLGGEVRKLAWVGRRLRAMGLDVVVLAGHDDVENFLGVRPSPRST